MSGAADDPAGTAPACWLVEIELKRVQTYLFAVPRLPVMVGANALMGETLRGLWLGDRFDAGVRSLPALAEECGAGWPAGVPAPDETSSPGEDPLVWVEPAQEIWQDDVATVARETGVLVRDGGHFKALLPDQPTAQQFIERARDLIQEQLPGVLLDVRLSGVGSDGQAAAEVPLPARPALDVLDPPQAEVCAYSGREPASLRLEDEEERPPVSESVAGRRARGRDFDAGKTRDVLGILRPWLLQDLGFDRKDARAFPAELAQLATRGYLGVVHVDGNSVGSRFRAYQEQQTGGTFFDRWRHAEAFFQPLRAGVRAAVRRAIQDVFGRLRTREGRAPLRLLMLGGDDLVLVCGAPLALRFVAALARHVRETTRDLPTGKPGQTGPLTLGAGVAVVQDTFPFHRSHELAEELASSAKRLKAAINGDMKEPLDSRNEEQASSAKRLKAAVPAAEGNVVDWIVTSEAWHGDIEATRREHFLTEDGLVLSGKPYRVLKSAGAADKSLEELLDDAERLAEMTRQDRVARSQLQGLARSLPLGRHTARFAAQVLPGELLKELRERGYLSPEQGPWVALPAGQRHLSQVLDLLELYELEVLRQEAERAGELVTREKS